MSHVLTPVHETRQVMVTCSRQQRDELIEKAVRWIENGATTVERIGAAVWLAQIAQNEESYASGHRFPNQPVAFNDLLTADQKARIRKALDDEGLPAIAEKLVWFQLCDLGKRAIPNVFQALREHVG